MYKRQACFLAALFIDSAPFRVIGIFRLIVGGGHHITRPGYDIAMLERCIIRAQQDWGVTVYLEPGEACACLLYTSRCV